MAEGGREHLKALLNGVGLERDLPAVLSLVVDYLVQELAEGDLPAQPLGLAPGTVSLLDTLVEAAQRSQVGGLGCPVCGSYGGSLVSETRVYAGSRCVWEASEPVHVCPQCQRRLG